jgi:hypothetical protein
MDYFLPQVHSSVLCTANLRNAPICWRTLARLGIMYVFALNEDTRGHICDENLQESICIYGMECCNPAEKPESRIAFSA